MWTLSKPSRMKKGTMMGKPMSKPMRKRRKMKKGTMVGKTSQR